MVWIDQDCYMANVQNWSTNIHGKWSELNNIFTWQMVWIDHDFYIVNGLNWPGCLHRKRSEIIMVFTMQIICIDLDFDMTIGLNWSQFLHDKWSELIMIVQLQMMWIDQDFYMSIYQNFILQSRLLLKVHGGSSNLWGSTRRRITFMYCAANEVESILEIQQWYKNSFYVMVGRSAKSEARWGALCIA